MPQQPHTPTIRAELSSGAPRWMGNYRLLVSDVTQCVTDWTLPLATVCTTRTRDLYLTQVLTSPP
jgi:hypothetical protein